MKKTFWWNLHFFYFLTSLQVRVYFFLSGLERSSASASLAFLALIPQSLATALAWRIQLKALKFLRSSVSSMARTLLTTGVTFITWPLNWVAFFKSSSEASPFLGFFEFNGNKISLDWYSFSLCTLRWSDSRDLFLRRKSTVMPILVAWKIIENAN